MSDIDMEIIDVFGTIDGGEINLTNQRRVVVQKYNRMIIWVLSIELWV